MRRLDPSELFELDPDRPELDAPVLVQALDGFIDAGAGKRLAREHLLATYESQVVARFDVDQLLDYRARRPAMLFVEDHWESYADPELAIHVLHDAAGTAFLLLSGPEPDVQWERFVEAVRMVVDRLGGGAAGRGEPGLGPGPPPRRPRGGRGDDARGDRRAGRRRAGGGGRGAGPREPVRRLRKWPRRLPARRREQPADGRRAGRGA